MKKFLSRFIPLCLAIVTLTASAAWCEDGWLSVSFREVNTASPIVANATLPASLANAIVAAVPDKQREDAKEDGFDLEQLAARSQALKAGDRIHEASSRYEMNIVKTPAPDAGVSSPGYLIVQTDKIRVPVPLSVTSLAVGSIQYLFKDFKDKGAELTTLIEELRKMPTGMIYSHYDQYDNSYLKLSLE